MLKEAGAQPPPSRTDKPTVHFDGDNVSAFLSQRSVRQFFTSEGLLFGDSDEIRSLISYFRHRDTFAFVGVLTPRLRQHHSEGTNL